VTFDATGLSEGSYSGNIQINSNDPDESSVTIAVNLDVTTTTTITIANSTPYTDQNSATLNDGDLIQIIYAGPDDTIDPPLLTTGQPTSGQPTDDDVLLETHAIGENFPAGSGQFSFTIPAYAAGGGSPELGDVIYVRGFNSNDLQTATWYGDAQSYTVLNVNGESYDPLIDAGQTDTPLPVELNSFNAYAGNGEVYLKWTTSSELNNAGFRVERKLKDSNSYEMI
ncbi:unnamed protein product, partial [marine sediment metagenome]